MMKTIIKQNKLINDIGQTSLSGKVKSELKKAAEGIKTARKSIDIALGDNELGDRDRKQLAKLRVSLNREISLLSRIVF